MSHSFKHMKYFLSFPDQQIETKDQDAAHDTTKGQRPHVVDEDDSTTSTKNTSSPSKTKDKQELSRQAKLVIDAFPLLDFMRSPVLMYPVKNNDDV